MYALSEEPSASATTPDLATKSYNSFYRPELDVLRFVAFVLVFLHHTLPRTGSLSTLSPTITRAIGSIADACGFGLCLFFALSAYLITELLLRESANFQQVNLRAFYIRRILRIWPLYFLGIGIGATYAVVKVGPSGLYRFVAYALLAGNWYWVGHGVTSVQSTPMDILWSISIEEQFYLFWPLCVTSTTRRFPRFAMCILAGTSAAALLLLGSNHARTDAVWFNSFVQFGMFSSGVAVSWLLRGEMPRWTGRWRTIGCIAGFALWWVASVSFHLKDRAELVSAPMLLFGYLFVWAGCFILLLSFLGLQHRLVPPWLIYLGKISFGLYVYHMLALYLSSRIGIGDGAARNLVGFVLTIVLASISYRFYEKPFLLLKKKFEIVKSRPA